MKIAIIGAGNIGGSLGQMWSAAGHDIVFGVRDPNSDKVQASLANTAGKARIETPQAAAAFGEVVVLAVPGNTVDAVARELGDLSGKIIVDTTNRFGASIPTDAPSGAEAIARVLPRTHVIKAFNTMGWERLVHPQINGLSATVFVVGDDMEAKTTVMHLAQDIGLDAVDAGPLSNAASVEAMARLWVNMARTMGREISFRLLR